MAKLLLLSTVLVAILMPILLATDPNPRRAVRRLWRGMLAFNAFYVFAVLEIYPRLPH